MRVTLTPVARAGEEVPSVGTVRRTTFLAGPGRTFLAAREARRATEANGRGPARLGLPAPLTLANAGAGHVPKEIPYETRAQGRTGTAGHDRRAREAEALRTTPDDPLVGILACAPDVTGHDPVERTRTEGKCCGGHGRSTTRT